MKDGASMVLHNNLYFGSSLQKKTAKILNKIEKKKKIDQLFCICLAFNPSNLLEIIKYNDLHHRIYENRSYIVVGLAVGEEEASYLLKKIIEDVYHKQHDVDVNKYFEISDRQERYRMHA